MSSLNLGSNRVIAMRMRSAVCFIEVRGGGLLCLTLLLLLVLSGMSFSYPGMSGWAFGYQIAD